MGVAAGPRGRECKTFTELKVISPQIPNGIYHLYPNGPNETSAKVHCKTESGKNWQAVYQQFGGPSYSLLGTGQVSTSTLSSSYASYDGVVAPYADAGVMGSIVNKVNFEYWLPKKGVTWQKQVQSYNTGSSVSLSALTSVKVEIEFDSNIGFEDAFKPGDISGRWGQMNGYVTMSYNGTNVGSTRLLNGWSATANNIGFAQANSGDNPGNGEHVISGSYGRHAISYVHNSGGYNTTRCVTTCWGGTEKIAEEHIWYVTNDWYNIWHRK